MEIVEDIVIVGAGIAGLTTSLALHRLGIGSIVLESSENLRITGFALTIWSNAWKVLDAVGIGNSLRQQHCQLPPRESEHEVRCVRSKMLLEALAKELPNDTIRYSSKVVAIDESGFFKLVHLANGNILKTKVLIGCDGVNSVVAKWLGFKKPTFMTDRYAIRGHAEFEDNNGFESKNLWLFRKGTRSAFVPCDDEIVYWFFHWTPFLLGENDIEELNPAMMKQLVSSKLEEIMPDRAKAAIKKTKLDDIALSRVRHRKPWELFRGNVSKGNVCVAGDAFHPMMPYIGQAGCAALEDGLVLARCLAGAFTQIGEKEDEKAEEYYKRIEYVLIKYSKERRWRVVGLVTMAYVVGFIQLGSGVTMNFLREKVFAKFLPKLILKTADFDCGKLR